MLSFGVKGGAKEGERVVDSLLLASNLANVGDAKTVRSFVTTETAHKASLSYIPSRPLTLNFLMKRKSLLEHRQMRSESALE